MRLSGSGATRWGKTGVVCLMILLFVSGCQELKSGSPNPEGNMEKGTQGPGLAAMAPIGDPPTAVTNSTAPVSSPTGQENPVKEVTSGFETGKPKEEETVTGPSKPENVSALKPVYKVGKGQVAITIDDGPTRYTSELLKVLRDNDVKVTFFFLGQNAAAFPKAVTEAVYDGNEIGYHSNSHPNMAKMTYTQQKTEFDLGLESLQKWDKEPVKLFRPPYGAYNNDTKLVTEEYQMSMVLWDEDPRDWSTTNPSEVVKNVLAQVKSGGIIVMHDHPSTIAALPDIIKGIRKKGLTLVTIPNGM